jgi:hypothetical protein
VMADHSTRSSSVSDRRPRLDPLVGPLDIVSSLTDLPCREGERALLFA